MWVMTPDGVGIIFSIGDPTIVHLVDDHGITVDDRAYAPTALRQAKINEIPEDRRPTNKELANSLGYF